MDKLKNPFLIIRKPLNLQETKFTFMNNIKRKVIFQSLMRDQKDFASINLNTLDEHFNYSYYFSIRKDNKWVKVNDNKLVIPEFINEDNGVEYSFNKYKNSNKLLVVFSSSSSIHNVYNYYKTLKDIKCNKIFFADQSFSEDKTKCSYFIGQSQKNNYEKKIINIIKKILSENNIQKKDVILVGSSKGGFAALYYAYKYDFSTCIVGSPTIYLGQQHRNNDFGLKVITNLAGGASEEHIQWLDSVIINELKNKRGNPNLYYHAGSKESRYLNQGISFLNKVKKKNPEKLDINLGNYESHKDVIKFYPKYLTDVLNSILSKNNG